jgi:hypothetical protein
MIDRQSPPPADPYTLISLSKKQQFMMMKAKNQFTVFQALKKMPKGQMNQLRKISLRKKRAEHQHCAML